MPYAYAGKVAGRYAKRSSYYNKTAKDTAVQALKTAQAVKSLLNVEIKAFDRSVSASVSDSGAIVPLANILQGDGNASRDGNSVKLVSMQLRSRVDQNTSASTLSTGFRWMIVRDMDNQGEVPAVTDILESASIISNLNITDYPRRFKVIADKMFTMNKDITTGKNAKVWSTYKKLNFHLKFSTAGTNDYKDNALFILYLSDEPTLEPTLTMECRTCFIDN